MSSVQLSPAASRNPDTCPPTEEEIAWAIDHEACREAAALGPVERPATATPARLSPRVMVPVAVAIAAVLAAAALIT